PGGIPAAKEVGECATARRNWKRSFRRQGSRHRPHQHRRRIQRSMTDQEGWQRQSGEAVSESEVSEEGWPSCAASSAEMIQAVAAALAKPSIMRIPRVPIVERT